MGIGKGSVVSNGSILSGGGSLEQQGVAPYSQEFYQNMPNQNLAQDQGLGNQQTLTVTDIPFTVTQWYQPGIALYNFPVAAPNPEPDPEPEPVDCKKLAVRK